MGKISILNGPQGKCFCRILITVRPASNPHYPVTWWVPHNLYIQVVSGDRLNGNVYLIRENLRLIYVKLWCPRQG